MSRFNKPTNRSADERRTVNKEGAVAYFTGSPEMDLYIKCACSLLSSTFYEEPRVTLTGRVREITNLASQVDPVFRMNLAVYLRNEMYLRTISGLLIAHLALEQKLDWRVVPKVTPRLDDIKEVVAMYRFLKSGSKARALPIIPNPLKKGIAETLRYKYSGERRKPRDSYEYRKYNRGGNDDISLMDLVRLSHPKPVDNDQSKLFRQLRDGELSLIETWQTILSAIGNDPKRKKEAWEDHIEKGLPYMEALRNLVNIMRAKVSDTHVGMVAQRLSDEKAVRNSKQLPFRFYSAYKRLFEEFRDGVVEGPPRKTLTKALESAMRISVSNIPGIEYLSTKKTLICVDTSASMRDLPISTNSKVYPADIAAVLGSALGCVLPNSVMGQFATSWKVEDDLSGILKNAKDLRSSFVGGGTEAQKPLAWATQHNLSFDRIVYFSDMQMWTGEAYGYYYDRSAFETAWNTYKDRVNPEARLVLFDLVGYKTTPIDPVRKDVWEIAGWSDRVFYVLDKLERGENFLDDFRKEIS